MSVEERVLRIENAFATLSELVERSESRTDTLIQLAARSDSRTSTLEQSLQTLVELARVQSERLDESNERLTALENNLTALSQIVVELAQGQRRAEERQGFADARLDRLAALVEKNLGGG
jgi:uncharacterized coiled-coil DUF342 family protein